MTEREKIYFLKLPPTDTIAGMAYKLLGNDGRSEDSPQIRLNEVEIGDTLVGYLPGWTSITPLPEEVAYTWVTESAPNAILTPASQKVGEVPYKNWGNNLTIVVGEIPNLKSLLQKRQLLGINNQSLCEDQGGETVKENHFRLLLSPPIDYK